MKKNKVIKNKNKIIIITFLFFTIIGIILATNQNLESKEINIKDDGFKSGISFKDNKNLKSIFYISNNPLKIVQSNASQLENRFTLQDVIPENLTVKDQKSSLSCWAYATLASLETNLALNDLKNNIETKVYDFSEMHMEYATTRVFLNDEINEKGYNVDPFKTGTFERASSYLTNGFGAVDESSMPFESYCNGCNTSENDRIDLSSIQNKPITAQVNDIVEFPTYEVNESNAEKIENLKIQLKNHIKTYGGIAASTIYTTVKSLYLNYETSAIYCDNKADCPYNHAITIVGWDDNYAVSNFGSLNVSEEERIKPTKPGAWIVKDSYGTGTTYTLEMTRAKYCNISTLKAECEANGWDLDPTLIPKENLEALLAKNNYFLQEDGTYYKKKGEEGFFYISYEDANIYSNLFGVLNASTNVTYDNIYQYSDLGWNYTKKFETDTGKIYLANTFEKNNSGEKEYLTQVSLYVPKTNTIKVYVNPNGNSLNQADLQMIELKAGENETFGKGYHTLEFATPVELNADEFAVVLEIQEEDSTNIDVRLEGYSTEGYIAGIFAISGIASGNGYYSTNMAEWHNLSEYVLDETKAQTDTNYIGADTTIKAFTISEIENIKIVSPPTKTTYIEGDDFDLSDMIVEITSKDGTKIEVTDYTIEDGTSLEVGQDSVTISYFGASVTQAITVEKNIVQSIEIKQSPTITEYIEGQSFDSNGMIIIAHYKNGTSAEITNYKVENGEQLKPSQSNILISYEEEGVQVNVTQSIMVKEKTLQSLTLIDDAVKKSYIEGQGFDSTGLQVIANYEYISLEITEEQYEIINGENLNLETTEVIIKYEENGISKENTIIIEVTEKEIINISIDTEPDKITYIEGQSFDSKGMKIVANYNDDDVIDVTEYVTIINGSSLELGQNSVIISYQEKQVTQSINVLEKKIKSISIKEFPNKKIYIQNKENLDLSGGVITVDYNNGYTETVEMTSEFVNVTGFDNTKIGTNTLLLAYEGNTLEFSVEVKEEELPKPSNFAHASNEIKNIKAYYYTNKKNDYVLIETKISKILKNSENDKLEYYYYLSSNKEEKNITDWVKIEETQNNNSEELEFTINTKDLKNYEEVSTADVLYLYIKEVATRKTKVAAVVTDAFILEATPEIEKYIDDKYEGKFNANGNIIVNPNTGNNILLLLKIMGAVSLISFVYAGKTRSKKYREIDI